MVTHYTYQVVKYYWYLLIHQYHCIALFLFLLFIAQNLAMILVVIYSYVHLRHIMQTSIISCNKINVNKVSYRQLAAKWNDYKHS